MACDSTLPSKADLQKLKRQAEFIAQVGTGRDANDQNVSQVTNPDTGETVITVRGWADQFDTLFADTQNEANDAIDTYRRINAGDYSSGPLLLDDKFTYATYNGDRFYAVSPPYTTDPVTFPDPNTDTNLILLDLPDEQFVRTVANETAEQILDGEIFPVDYDQNLQVGQTVPSGTIYVRLANYGIVGMRPSASGIVNSISGLTLDVGGVTVECFLASDYSLGSISKHNNITEAINSKYGIYIDQDSSFSSITPKNNSRFTGNYGATVSVPVGQSAFVGNGTSDDFKYAEISNLRAEGNGKVPDGTKFISFDGQGNRVFNLFRGLRLADFDTCVEYSAGWGNTSIGVDHRGSVNGVKYNVSPIQPGWAGSGNTSIGCSYQYCDVGINHTGVPWGDVIINPILEGNDIGWIAEGNDAVMIGAWFEVNTKDIQIERGFTTIGGGQKPTWTLPDVSIFNADEMINIINASQVTMTRGLPDGSDAVFHANGQGVKQIQSSQGSVNTEPDRMRLGGSVFTQPGDTTGYNFALHGAYFASRFGNIYDDTAESTIINMKFRAKQSLSGTGGAVGQLEFDLGQYENTGLPFNSITTPLILKPNLVTTGGDAEADLGDPAHRFNNSYFAVAPTVGSSVHIKKNIREIPQPLCDFALSVENKMYELINGTSGRDHFGIIIDDDFLSAIKNTHDIDKLGVLCNSIFTDENGNKVTRHICGYTVNIRGLVDHDLGAYKYQIPEKDCELDILGNLIIIENGVLKKGFEGVDVDRDYLIDSATYIQDLEKLRNKYHEDVKSKEESIGRFLSRIDNLEGKLQKSKSEEERVKIKQDLLLATKGLEIARDLDLDEVDINQLVPPPIKFTFGGVKIGEFWQCRYDEWQNICLEAHRRLSIKQGDLISDLTKRIEKLENKS